MRQRYHSKFIDHAASVAIETPRRFRASIACSLVYKNRHIICTCTNSFKSHPFQKKFSHHEDAIYRHAENACIIRALQIGFDIADLRDCSLYIARASATLDGDVYLSNCRPCRGCQRSIAAFGIEAVFFTVENGVEQL